MSSRKMVYDDTIPTRRLVARIGLRILIVVSILLAVFILWPIICCSIPFILALLVSNFILMPIIRKLSGRLENLRKFWAIVFVIIIMVLVIAVLGVIVYYLISQVIDVFKKWDVYQVNIDHSITAICNFVSSHTSLSYNQVSDGLYMAYEKGIDWAGKSLPGKTPEIISKITSYVPTIGSMAISFLFFLMAVYFVCADYPNIRAKIKAIIPSGLRPYIRQIRSAAGSATFGYLRAQLIISAIVAAVSFVTFLIIKQKYALLVALLVGVIDFIPMLGGGILLTPWGIVNLIIGDYSKAIVLFVLCVCIFLFRRIVEPRVVGNQTGLHPLLSLFSLYLGIKLGGLLGLIIAPILCMMILGLIQSGFFTPTVLDIRLLWFRMANYTGMIKDDSFGDEEKNKSIILMSEEQKDGKEN